VASSGVVAVGGNDVGGGVAAQPTRAGRAGAEARPGVGGGSDADRGRWGRQGRGGGGDAGRGRRGLGGGAAGRRGRPE
jgi:hypothetical protein